MSYDPTTWVNNQAPGITAEQLNRMETGIDEAHDFIAEKGEASGLASLDASSKLTTSQIPDIDGGSA